MTIHGAFHWNELMTHDVAKAKDFYAKALGWEYEGMPMPDMDFDYTIIKSGGQMVGAGFTIQVRHRGFERMPRWGSGSGGIFAGLS